MATHQELIQNDLKHIWHPATQMKDFESYPPLVVSKAKGSYIYTNEGPLIDAISSWWCKSLGHGHPTILSAIKTQLDSFEHVISAQTTHPTMVELGEKLAMLTKNQHVFFASDGASAVEIAIKLTLHALKLKGQAHKTQFIALKNGYHGETLATLSVSDLALYKKPFEGYGLSCHYIQSIPYVSDKLDPLWSNCESYWKLTLEQLEKIKEHCCAIILEPIIQGAGGMRCYSADFLNKLAHWAKANAIYLIADEIMTGFGRTGKWLACEHSRVQADIICLSKGLTSGSLPLSCISLSDEIYALFYDDYNKGKSFLHSHTFSGNALALSAALATIKVMEAEGIVDQVEALGQLMYNQFSEIARQTQQLKNVRSIGAIVAAELADNEAIERIGFKFYQEAVKRGALIRPLGRTLYWLPPLNCGSKIIENLAEITLNSIKALYPSWL